MKTTLASLALALAVPTAARGDMKPGFPTPPPLVSPAMLDAVAVPEARSLPEALQALKDSGAEIDRLLDRRALAGLREQAQVISAHARTITRLAREDAALTEESRASITRSAKSLNSASVRLDAASTGDVEVARRVEWELVEITSRLGKLIAPPVPHACPKCPGVTSPKPGACPACGGALVAKPGPPAE